MAKKLIRFDWAIKRLLRNKANFVILEGFLSELLFEDIKIHKILESEGNQEHDFDKYNRVDMLVENSKGELIIIEVQNDSELDYFHRILFGTSKLVTEYIDMGDSYAQLKKVISINIVYFDLGQGEDYLYRGQTSFIGMRENDLLSLSPKQQKYFNKERIENIFPEYYLIKANKFDDIAKDTLDEWIYFLKNSEVKDEFKAKGLKEAKETLDIMKLPKTEQQTYKRFLEGLRYQKSMVESMKFEAQYEAEQLKEELERQVLEKGIEEGRKQEKILIATEMILDGISNEKIIRYTELSESEIEHL